jgi:hypothetical protein
MAILLAIPMIRECCIPEVQADHCHQSQNPARQPCTRNPVAVVANKTTVEFSTVDFASAINPYSDVAGLDFTNSAAQELAFSRPNIPIDRYLRTTVLLI